MVLLRCVPGHVKERIGFDSKQLGILGQKGKNRTEWEIFPISEIFPKREKYY